jgi:hypothetical protein
MRYATKSATAIAVTMLMAYVIIACRPVTPTPPLTKTPSATATATRWRPGPSVTATSAARSMAIDAGAASVSSAGFIAINAGGGAYQDYDADRPYIAPGSGYIGGQTYAMSTPINGPDAPLYQTERYNMSAYKADLPNGTYKVELSFAEIYFTYAGARVFDVQVQGVTVLQDLDIFAEAPGLNVPRTYVTTAQVLNGQLTISFIPKKNNPKISALRISPAGTPTATPTTKPTATGTPTPTAAPPPSKTPTATAPPTPSVTPTPTITPTGTPTHDDALLKLRISALETQAAHVEELVRQIEGALSTYPLPTETPK